MEIRWNDPQQSFESKKSELINIYLNLYDKMYHPAILSLFQNLKIAYYGKEALLRSTLEQVQLIASMDTYVFFRKREGDYPKASDECLEILKGIKKDYSDPAISILSQQLFEGPFFSVHFAKEETKKLLEEVISEHHPFASEGNRGMLYLDLLSDLKDIGAIRFHENPLNYVKEAYDEEAQNRESKAFQMRYQLWKKEYPTMEPENDPVAYQNMLLKLRKLEPIVSLEERTLKRQVTPYLKEWFSYHLSNVFYILNAERQLCQSLYYDLDEQDQRTISQDPHFSPRALLGFSKFTEANPTYRLQDDLCKLKGEKYKAAYQNTKRNYYEQKIKLSCLTPIGIEESKKCYQTYENEMEIMMGFSYRDTLFLNLDRTDSIDDNFDLMLRVNLEQQRLGGMIYKWGLLGTEKSEELAYLDIVSNFYISKKVREKRREKNLKIWDRNTIPVKEKWTYERFEQLLEVLPLSDFLEARIAPNLDPLLKHGLTVSELKDLGRLVMLKDEASGVELSQKIEELKGKQKRK